MHMLTHAVAGGALLLTLAVGGCDDSVSPGRPRVPGSSNAIRPPTTPGAVIADWAIAYRTHDLELLAGLLDPHRYTSTYLGRAMPACDYDCELARTALLFQRWRTIQVSVSMDTIPLQTLVPLEPPGALAFHLRAVSLNPAPVGTYNTTQSVFVVVAPTGPREAPWRITQWAWGAGVPVDVDTTATLPADTIGTVFVDYGFGGPPATAEGAVHALESAFSHAQVANAVAYFSSVIDSTQFQHTWEVTDASTVHGRGAASEAAYLAYISRSPDIVDLRLTLWPTGDSLVWVRGAPASDSTRLQFDLANTNQRIAFRDGRVLNVGFVHSVITVAKDAPSSGAPRWRVVRWEDRGPLPASVAMPARTRGVSGARRGS